jgi:hypothetical protein
MMKLLKPNGNEKKRYWNPNTDPVTARYFVAAQNSIGKPTGIARHPPV